MSAQTAAEEEKIYTDAFLGDRSWNGRERNQLLLNQGDGTFVECGSALGLDGMEDARGLAAADFDRDGDIDFLINNYKARATYYQNDLGHTRKWLALRVRGTSCNRDGIGAIVRVRVGDQLQARVVGAGHGYAAQYSLEQIVGLGDAPKADGVWVAWPGGVEEAFGPLDAGQRVTLVQGEGIRPAKREGTTVWHKLMIVAMALLAAISGVAATRRG